MKRFFYQLAIISISATACGPIYHNAMPRLSSPELVVKLESTRNKTDERTSLFTVCLASTEDYVEYHFTAINIQPLYDSKSTLNFSPWEGGCILELGFEESSDDSRTIKLPCNNLLQPKHINSQEIVGLVVHAKMMEQQLTISDTLIFKKEIEPNKRTYTIQIDRQTIFPKKERKHIFGKWRTHLYID